MHRLCITLIPLSKYTGHLRGLGLPRMMRPRVVHTPFRVVVRLRRVRAHRRISSVAAHALLLRMPIVHVLLLTRRAPAQGACVAEEDSAPAQGTHIAYAARSACVLSGLYGLYLCACVHYTLRVRKLRTHFSFL